MRPNVEFFGPWKTSPPTLAFHESRDAERKSKMRAGLKPEREAEVLAAWKKEQNK